MTPTHTPRLLGGLVLSLYGANVVFGCAAIAHALCFTITLCFLRESIPRAQRRLRISLSDAIPLRGMEILLLDRRIFLLACSHSIDKLGSQAYSIWILFIRQVLQWSALEVGAMSHVTPSTIRCR